MLDQLTGGGSHEIETNWHCGSEEFASRLILGRVDEHLGRIDAERLEGQTSPMSGWTSRMYGQKSPSINLRTKESVSLPARLYAVCPLSADAPGEAEIRELVEKAARNFDSMVGA